MQNMGNMLHVRFTCYFFTAACLENPGRSCRFRHGHLTCLCGEGDRMQVQLHLYPGPGQTRYGSTTLNLLVKAAKPLNPEKHCPEIIPTLILNDNLKPHIYNLQHERAHSF